MLGPHSPLAASIPMNLAAELFRGGMMLPLMFVNAAATCYLFSLTAPLPFMKAWTKALETTG